MGIASLRRLALISIATLLVGVPATTWSAAGTKVLMPLSAVDGQRNDIPDCLVPIKQVKVTDCWLVGGKVNRPLVVILGDSHVHAYAAAIYEVATRHGLRVNELTKRGCSFPSLSFGTGRDDPYPECATWRSSAISRAASQLPDAVVTSSIVGRSIQTSGTSIGLEAPAYPSAWQQGFQESAKSLLSGAKSLLQVREIPVYFQFPGGRNALKSCLDTQEVKQQQGCGLAQQTAMGLQTPVWEREMAVIEDSPAMYGLDFTGQFCSEGVCYPTSPDGSRRYRDEHHLVPDYTRTLWRAFSFALAKQMTLPPSSIDRLKVKKKQQKLVLQWKESLPGSGAKPKYKVSFTPQGGSNSKAKKYSCETNKTKCKSGRVPLGSKYKVKVLAKNSAGKSPAKIETVKVKK